MFSGEHKMGKLAGNGLSLTWDHSFSMYGKFSEKLTFPTPIGLVKTESGFTVRTVETDVRR